MKKSALLLLSTFLLLAQAIAQQITVSGKVTSGGTPVAGVSVSVKNTKEATLTNQQGDYSVKAKQGDVLIFSHIGYVRQEQTVGTSTNIPVQLQSDAVGLDEVIVTGTSQGTTRKQLGSYVSSVKGDDLNKAPSGNVLASLQGKTAGAQISQNSGDPAGGISVRLRGISSVNSSSEPLYIIDGVIVSNNTTRVTNTSANYDGGNFVGSIGQNRMVDINPADIERIEVLNGAAAAAIYGSRANAGVIQIFTKRGASGAPQINFGTSLTLGHLRKQVEVNESPVKFGGSPNVFTQDVIATPLQTTTTPVQRYNYQDYIFRSSTGTDNTLSISGGNDNTKYYTSAGYFSNQGIIRNTNFRRYNFRTNLDQKLTDWAKFSAGLNYVKSSANEKPDGNSFFSPMNSVTILGNFHDIFARNENGNLMAVGERGRVNPVSVIEDIKQRQETDRIIANANLKLTPVKNLTLDFTMGVDNSAQNGTTYIPPFAYNVNPDFFGGGASLDGTLNGYASTANNNAFQFNNELNATYEAKISDILSSTTQVGYSYQYEKSKYALISGRGLAPLIETVNAASTPLPGIDGRTELSVSGGYIQQNFKYRDHLFVTGALRIDQSSVFGKDFRTQKYLKGSVSYVLSSTEYWKKLGVSSWWDTFKIRGAYGESGNLTGIGAYARFNAYETQSFLGRASLFSSATLANENVKPERQRELELGTDLSFFKNRLGLQFNWYNKKVDDLLLASVIAPSVGFSNLLDNIGSLRNKGIEVVLNGTPVKGEKWNWNTSFIYSRNRNEALDVGGLRLFSTNSGAPVSIINGQPIGVFYGTFFARNPDGSLLTNAAGIPMIERGIQNSATTFTPQRDANGMPTGTTLRKVLGNPNPDYTFSFVNDISYKKLSLHVQLDAVRGGDVWNADWRTRQGVGNGKVAEQEQKGELPRGYVSGVYAIEEWRIDNGSFVKLREVSLSYNVGKVKYIKDLTINVSGRNLISWDNYKGYDPELNAGGQSTILRNIDFGAVPIPRTFSIGLLTKF
ncbi:SusC/RagA family TonB-linked outer membrane protein [Sphingobacterium spiritivorum]|uniref:TonB-linked outer membrane protein, SusC/RagA family n=1 Tax=Sphingobacterium spiritivorum ATCC 33861 TaxID=525373 RepID=D7VQB5_SPHSI|nr:SusC/RagA family TonB-linked outer membrane protein [Sphingobacterium spiritivorum]EFK55966.1 TonB-linked outer membrane protein, SusC/RagA family [Sphingobacterium spiritivorum ATCC 33861]QQT35900.1 SusC/RagA family TonB-linked outer membrane protein [Sphingobacterium spiritivorum]WQD32628.1 SusC/RagA family TonB-linked outer membrane protein [Sphingobacterium spiritivorum]SUJ12107.1 Outer membrane cobalamin receptor protein [Sphingobacterium spiritivorum]